MARDENAAVATRLTLPLLTDTDPAPVEVINPHGAAGFVLTCEHAGRAVPASLGALGLEDRDFDRHIAWDIGAAGMVRAMAELIDAPVVMQTYSRLVIDCNRPLGASDSIPAMSDGTAIPGNANLSTAERVERSECIHAPYHARIAELLDRRERGGRKTALISMHSFTPALSVDPAPRPWDVGLLFRHHEKLSAATRDALGSEAGHLKVTFNQPYFVSDATDYTVPIHGEQRGLANMLVEIRNDHIDDANGQREWAKLFARLLANVTSRL